MSRTIKWTCAIAVLAAAAGLIPVFAHEGHARFADTPFDLDSPRRPSPETIKAIDLTTAEVDFGPVEETVHLGGIVRPLPDNVQIVAARAEGTVARVDVRPGDSVTRGQVLAEVNSPVLATMTNEVIKTQIEHERVMGEIAADTVTVEQLKAQVAASDEQAKLVEAEAARMEAGGEGVGANAVSQKRAAAVHARSQVTQLQFSLTQQEKLLASLKRQAGSLDQSVRSLRRAIELVRDEPLDPSAAESDVGTARLKAGLDGLVVSRDAVVGQGVASGQQVLRIVNLSSVQIDGELPESLVDRLGNIKGNAVRVRRAGADQPLVAGEVLFVSPTVEPVMRTAHLVIRADNPGAAMRDGMYVDLDVVIRQKKDAVVVPVSAVVTDGPMTFVFIKDKDAFVKRDIVPGIRDDRVVEVVSGLVPGDVVVTRGAYSLTQLRPKGAPGAAPADPHAGHSH